MIRHTAGASVSGLGGTRFARRVAVGASGADSSAGTLRGATRIRKRARGSVECHGRFVCRPPIGSPTERWLVIATGARSIHSRSFGERRNFLSSSSRRCERLRSVAGHRWTRVPLEAAQHASWRCEPRRRSRRARRATTCAATRVATRVATRKGAAEGHRDDDALRAGGYSSHHFLRSDDRRQAPCFGWRGSLAAGGRPSPRPGARAAGGMCYGDQPPRGRTAVGIATGERRGRV